MVLWEALGPPGRPSSPKAPKMAPQGAQRVPQQTHFGSHWHPKGHQNHRNHDKNSTQERDLRKEAKMYTNWISKTLKSRFSLERECNPAEPLKLQKYKKKTPKVLRNDTEIGPEPLKSLTGSNHKKQREETLVLKTTLDPLAFKSATS